MMYNFRRGAVIFIMTLYAVMVCMGSTHANNLIIKSSPDVTVVFVKPASMPRYGESEAKSDMSYDLTLTSRSDSISFTASIFTMSPAVIDSVLIAYGDSCVLFPVEKIFIEPDGSKWQNRLRVYIPKDVFNDLLYCESPPVFRWGTHCIVASFKHKSSKWLSMRSTLRLADEVIERNRVYERPGKTVLDDIEQGAGELFNDVLGL